MTQREIAEIRAAMHKQNWRKDGSLKTEHVRLYGLSGTWYLKVVRYTMDGVFYLWKSEQREERPAVLTNEHLMVIDYC